MPKGQPLIGLTGGQTHNKSGSMLCQVGQAYITAIQKAGGYPLLIPTGIKTGSLRAIIQRLDGILLTGGGDIDPKRFYGQPHPKVYGVSPARDALELGLIEDAIFVGKPLLAICRGIQVLNVAFGGTLHTHIEGQLENALKHDWFPNIPRDRLAHSVNLKHGSNLQEVIGEESIEVNSLHHQGIDRVGQGLEAIGYAPDGLVEALIVKESEFALGVQWHPECLPDDPGNQALFKAFIESC